MILPAALPLRQTGRPRDAAPRDAPLNDAADPAEFAVVLDPAFVGFAGHFPGAPVFPGMCQVDLVLRAAAVVAGEDLDLVEIERARFKRRATPGEELRIRVTVRAAAPRQDANRPDALVSHDGASRSGEDVVEASLAVGDEPVATLRLRVARRAASGVRVGPDG